MTLFGRIREFIKGFDTAELYKMFGIIVGIILVPMGLLMYHYYSSIQNLQKRLLHLNQQREQSRLILERHALVLQQRAKVDEILAKDKGFKLKQYFTSVLQGLGMGQYVIRDPEISSEELTDGYNEIKLNANLNGINMKQLADMLFALEQNERVYLKDLKITKEQKSSALEVALVIGTFEASVGAL